MDGYTIDGDRFKVLLNDEGQYSIWPALKDIPNGWMDAGFEGDKAQCTEYIDKTWTDMRPLSLQHAMNDAGEKS